MRNTHLTPFFRLKNMGGSVVNITVPVLLIKFVYL